MRNDAADDARAEVCALLLGLAELAAETEAAERRILAGAQDRLVVVSVELDALRPRAIADQSAGHRYLELTAEAGKLEAVIVRAGQLLGL